MRDHRKLTTKRRATKASVWKTLHASVKEKKQRAAAIASSEGMEFQSDVPNLSISRALIVLLALHILAIGGMYAHNKWFSETEQPVVIEQPTTPIVTEPVVVPEARPAPQVQQPTKNTGYELYVVSSDDTYESISETKSLDSYELRRINNNRPLRSGSVLRLPAKMVKPVITQPAVAAAPVNPPAPVIPAPAPQVVEEEIPVAVVVEEPARPVSYGTHVVAKGESVWRISRRYGIGQETLMSLNGISDPSKLRIGQKLKIPNN